jgi:hypothetical protein
MAGMRPDDECPGGSIGGVFFAPGQLRRAERGGLLSGNGHLKDYGTAKQVSAGARKE